MKPNDQTVIARVYKLTRNVQDAEDAVQGAYLYQMVHGLKRKHFIWKAMNLAKNRHRDQDHFEPESDTAHTLDCSEKLMAKDLYGKIHGKLSPANQFLLKALLENNASPKLASEDTGRPAGHFKTLIYNLRNGLIK